MKKLLLALIALAGVAFGARAQDLWQPRTSGTTTNLWGVAYAANQWVAVGEQGTILTSPDGSIWTARTSGFPTRWLVAVGYGTANGAGLWVVVGENGLILTSPDAVTWTARRTSGTRINAVAYGNGTFVAADDAGSTYYSTDGVTWNGPSYGGRNTFARGLVYGAPNFVVSGLNSITTTYDGVTSSIRVLSAPQMQGAAYGRGLYLVTGGANTYTSRDAISWTQQPATTTMGVQGATFFNNQFVAVGNGGAIAATFDGSAWTDRASGTTQTLIAIGASTDSAVVVGFGGTILQSAATPAAPGIVRAPAAVTEAVGGNVSFTITASGSLPLTYQWRKDGVPIDGATSDTLLLATVQAARAGKYSCTVTNAIGSVTSSDATLSVVDTFPAANPVDGTFTLSPAFNAGPRVAVAQPDGKFVLGGAFLLLNQGQAQYGLARVNADGSLDLAFKPGTLDSNSTVQALAMQPDGKILAGGSFTTVNGISRRGVARFNPDGSLDGTFVPAASVSGTFRQLLVQSDGRILLVNGGQQLTRLLPDGSVDPQFQATSIAVGAVGSGNIVAVDLQTDGKIIVGLTGSSFGTTTGFVRRLNADGTLDQSFASIGLGVLGGGIVGPFVLRVLPDGRIATATSNNSGGTSLQRFLANGSTDLTFQAFSSNALSATSVAITSDGQIWLGGIFTSVNFQNVIVARNQLFRVNADGSLDATYNPGSGFASSTGGVAPPLFLLPLADGRLVVTGDFVRVNGANLPQVVVLNTQSTGGANLPQLVALSATYIEARAGVPFTVTITASGSAQLRYTLNGSNFGANSDSSTITVTNPQSSGVYTGNITNAVGASSPFVIYVRVIPSVPTIVQQPSALQTNTGRPITLVAVVGGSAPLTYQWFKNDVAIAGATGATYTIAKSTVADTGDYTVVVRNNLGFTTSQTVHVGVDETARIINLATRGNTTSTASPLIVGFVIQGLGSKRVTIRAVGPSLEQFNVPGFLVDPVLKVYNGSGALIYTNDNWNQSNDVPGIASSPQRLGAFPLNDASKDAAGILTLSPGTYTAVITGAPVNGVETSGVVLGEIYEDDQQSARLINLSSRGFVSPGASIMIPGFVTTTTATQAPKKFLIRGIGPALQQFGVTNALLNPTLNVVDSTGRIVATNDDWEQNSNVDELRAVTTQQAFPLPAGSKDAALLVSLTPGSYTCLVSGIGNTSGTALVEIYEVP